MDKEVDWIRNRATDYQIESIINQRDRLLTKYAAAVQAMEVIMQLIADGDLVRNIKHDSQALKISDALKNANGILIDKQSPAPISTPEDVVSKIPECCAMQVAIFELSGIGKGDWVAHCTRCFDGTMPQPTKEAAIAAWDKECGYEDEPTDEKSFTASEKDSNDP